MNRPFLVLLVLASQLVGCDAMMYKPFAPGNVFNRDGNFLGAKQPTSEELATADYGTPIQQETAQQLVQAWLALRLKDAESARYQWGPVDKGWVKDAPVIGGQIYTGYVLHVLVNAKNSYGGYTGFEEWTFMFRDGNVARVYHQSGIPVQ